VKTVKSVYSAYLLCTSSKEFIQFTAVSLGGASGSMCSEAVVFLFKFLRWGEVFQIFGDQFGSDSFVEESQHFEGPVNAFFGYLQFISGFNFGGGFDTSCIDFDEAGFAAFCGNGTCFEDTHTPEPFVDSHDLFGAWKRKDASPGIGGGVLD
jgi:hypothetical protein